MSKTKAFKKEMRLGDLPHPHVLPNVAHDRLYQALKLLAAIPLPEHIANAEYIANLATDEEGAGKVEELLSLSQAALPLWETLRARLKPDTIASLEAEFLLGGLLDQLSKGYLFAEEGRSDD